MFGDKKEEITSELGARRRDVTLTKELVCIVVDDTKEFFEKMKPNYYENWDGERGIRP